jgi:hypothetical protein
MTITFGSLRAKFEPMGALPQRIHGCCHQTRSILGRVRDQFTRDIKEEFEQQVERAIEWLKLCEQTKHLDRRQTSYGIKHEAERWCREQGHPNGGYISNGALLMAAYTLGFKVQRPTNYPDFPNAFLNVSRRRPRAKAAAPA